LHAWTESINKVFAVDRNSSEFVKNLTNVYVRGIRKELLK